MKGRCFLWQIIIIAMLITAQTTRHQTRLQIRLLTMLQTRLQTRLLIRLLTAQRILQIHQIAADSRAYNKGPLVLNQRSLYF